VSGYKKKFKTFDLVRLFATNDVVREK